MALRPAFYVSNGIVSKKNVEFEWAGGFALSQKQKNVARMHEMLPGLCLEVSTKSLTLLGKRLSAFNLSIDGISLENAFQSSKVFLHGGPYLDLLKVSPRDAKRDERLRTSGPLVKFQYRGVDWPLEPVSVFYDFLYYQACRGCLSSDDLKELQKYKYFTDIEFNPAKSINTQAKAICLVKLYYRRFGELPDISREDFIDFHRVLVSC